MKKTSAESETKNDGEKKPSTEKTFAEKLSRAIVDLFYISETDAPFETVIWQPETGAAAFSGVNAELVLRLTGKPPETPLRESSLEDFFRPLVAEQDWYGDEEKATAARFAKLKELLAQNLRDAKVFKIGAVQIEIYIVGILENGALAGVKTLAVET